ncbi:MAG: hypothetical protein WDN29_16105 [Methylovirgula sp.]
MAIVEENAAAARAEEKAAFLLRLRTGGIRDLDLLRALEKVPREMFVPHRFVDLARRDLVLPIGLRSNPVRAFAGCADDRSAWRRA